MRVVLGLIVLALAGSLGAQALTITSTDVTYSYFGSCDGNPTITLPVMQATGGSGNYAWTALTSPPPNLALNTDGTFSGIIVQSMAGLGPWTFDVEVLDTTSASTAQATITMHYVAATPGCSGDDDDGGGCASSSASGAFVLLLLAALAFVLRLSANTPRTHAPGVREPVATRGGPSA